MTCKARATAAGLAAVLLAAVPAGAQGSGEVSTAGSPVGGPADDGARSPKAGTSEPDRALTRNAQVAADVNGLGTQGTSKTDPNARPPTGAPVIGSGSGASTGEGLADTGGLAGAGAPATGAAAQSAADPHPPRAKP